MKKHVVYPTQKVWNIICGSTFNIELNANDFFGYACAGSVELCIIDTRWAFPIIEEFGDSGLNAVMSYIEDCLPIEERIDEDFHKALNKITQLQPLIYSKIEEWPRELLDLKLKGKITTATRAEQKGRIING
jgi:hypothetical protein